MAVPTQLEDLTFQIHIVGAIQIIWSWDVHLRSTCTSLECRSSTQTSSMESLVIWLHSAPMLVPSSVEPILVVIQAGTKAN